MSSLSMSPVSRFRSAGDELENDISLTTCPIWRGRLFSR